MLNRVIFILIPLCLLLLVACTPQPTATPSPTDEPWPTETPTVKPTEVPKATQAAQASSTGNQALDQIIASNLPGGATTFGVNYTPKTDNAGAKLEIFYPIESFWTILGMLKVSYTTFYAETPLLFEADPDFDYVTFVFQKPAYSEKEEVGPQPVLVMEVSRESAAKVTSDTPWCELYTVIDKVEFSPEAASTWSEFCH